MSRGPMPPGAKPRTKVGPRLKLSMIGNSDPSETRDLAALEPEMSDEIVGDRVIIAAIDGLANELAMSPPTPAISWWKFTEAPLRRILAVVQRVPDQRIADERGDGHPFSRGLLDRDRSFAVGQALSPAVGIIGVLVRPGIQLRLFGG